MGRVFLVLTLSGVLLLSFPASAHACGLLEFDCIFGFTERTQIRADSNVEQARIAAERDRQIAEAQAEAERQKREADAAVERAKNERYATQAQADIAIAQAEAQRDMTMKVIDSWMVERVNIIDAQQAAAVAGLQGQALIAIEGVRQAGETERTRENNDRTVLGIIVLAALIITVTVSYTRHQKQMYMLQSLQEQRRQLESQQQIGWRVARENEEIAHYDR